MEKLSGPGATGTARWSGVALADVLGLAGPLREAAHVGFEGADVCEQAEPPERFGGSIPLDKACRPEVLLADHSLPVKYEIPLPPPMPVRQRAGEPIGGRALYIHTPRGRAGRAIDNATERFVDETRMGATP